MKEYYTWTIKIRQKHIKTIAPSLDLYDMAILSYLVEMSEKDGIKKYHSKKARFKYEGGTPDWILFYFWCSNNALCKNMPLLKIKSKSAIQKRMRKLEECSFIIRDIHGKNQSIVYLADKSRLIWADNLPSKNCENCRRYCEDCEYFWDEEAKGKLPKKFMPSHPESE